MPRLAPCPLPHPNAVMPITSRDISLSISLTLTPAAQQRPGSGQHVGADERRVQTTKGSGRASPPACKGCRLAATSGRGHARQSGPCSMLALPGARHRLQPFHELVDALVHHRGIGRQGGRVEERLAGGTDAQPVPPPAEPEPRASARWPVCERRANQYKCSRRRQCGVGCGVGAHKRGCQVNP